METDYYIPDTIPDYYVPLIEELIPLVVETKYEHKQYGYYPCECGRCMNCLGMSYRDFM